jgi:acetyl esterase
MADLPKLEMAHTMLSETDALRLLEGHRITRDGRTMDPKAQIVGEFVKSIRVPGYFPPLPELRQQLVTMTQLMDEPAPALPRIEDLRIGNIPARLYSPQPVGHAPLPALAYFHGGGWVQGDLQTHNGLCARLALWSGAIVVAVDYRLAPEHKFPAAIDDSVAVYRALNTAAVELGIDPARIVLAGDSAGGNIAAVAAQLLRAERRPPCLQWLIFPATDLGFDTPSYKSCGEGFFVTRAAMEWFRGHYLNDQSEIDDPRASPLRAAELSGLAPALIFTNGIDPLRDEGRAYGDRLTVAGVKTIHREFDSLIHGFVGMRGALQAAARAMDDMVAGLRHELAQLGR